MTAIVIVIGAAIVIYQAFKSDADEKEEEAVQEVTKKTAAVTVKEKHAAVAEHVEVCVSLC